MAVRYVVRVAHLTRAMPACPKGRRSDQEFRQQVQDVAQPITVADELAKLADLRDRGVISSVDFEAAKTKLLGKSSTGRVNPA